MSQSKLKAELIYYGRFIRFYTIVMSIFMAVSFTIRDEDNGYQAFAWIFMLVMLSFGFYVISFVYGICFQHAYGTTLFRLILLAAIQILVIDAAFAICFGGFDLHVVREYTSFAEKQVLSFLAGAMLQRAAQFLSKRGSKGLN